MILKSVRKSKKRIKNYTCSTVVRYETDDNKLHFEEENDNDNSYNFKDNSASKLEVGVPVNISSSNTGVDDKS